MRPCSRRVHVYLHARVYPDHLKTGDALRERAYSSVILINRAFDIEHWCARLAMEAKFGADRCTEMQRFGHSRFPSEQTEYTLYTRAGLEIHFYRHRPSKVGHRKSGRDKTVVSVTIWRWYPVFIIVAPRRRFRPSTAGGYSAEIRATCNDIPDRHIKPIRLICRSTTRRARFDTRIELIR